MQGRERLEMQTRGMRALLAAVIVMGVMILLGTAVLISTVVRRAMRPPVGAVATVPPPADAAVRQLTLDQPPGTRIASVVRQSDTVLAVTLSGGGRADRLLLWDVAAGRLVGRLTLDREGDR